MGKRVLVGLLTLVLAMLAVGTAPVATAQPAATCSGPAYVVARVTSELIIVSEADPPDTPPRVVFVDVPNGTLSSVTVRLGGGGLQPGSVPEWSIYDANGTPLGTLRGKQADANCVSAETSALIWGISGDYYLAKANFQSGNSGRLVSRNHFALTFV